MNDVPPQGEATAAAAAPVPADLAATSDTRRLLPKPEVVTGFEAWLGARIPVHPHLLSGAKLLVATPMIGLALAQAAHLGRGPGFVLGWFAVFCALDYLDGVVARARGLETGLGRVFDRLTDYPLLMLVAYHCLHVLPVGLLAAKIGLDLSLFTLFLLGRGSSENRARTTISYTTLLALLVASQGWLPRLVTLDTVAALLWMNVVFSSIVALYNLRALQKRFVADTISAANLLCGVFSMIFAARGHVEISLLFLILGAVFDGFDGAAARRWGGTSWGVYSDDIADGVNYGVAPGVALALVLGGAAGVAIGIAYSVFTISRLVYFTLNKSQSDPNHFQGAPSTLGAMIVLCALALFRAQPALVGMFAGVAIVLMVSFSAPYRHLGRSLGDPRFRRKRVLAGALGYVLLLIVGAELLGPRPAIAVVLATCLAYGFAPTVGAFRRVLAKRA